MAGNCPSILADLAQKTAVTIAAVVTPNGAFVCVTCLSFTAGPKLAVIDTATNSVVTILPLPPSFSPFAIAISPNGAFAYAANSGGVTGPSSLSVIDTATNTEVATVPVQRIQPE